MTVGFAVAAPEMKPAASVRPPAIKALREMFIVTLGIVAFSSSSGTGSSCEPDEARARRPPEAYVGVR